MLSGQSVAIKGVATVSSNLMPDTYLLLNAKTAIRNINKLDGSGTDAVKEISSSAKSLPLDRVLKL